jgi:hypothetical protein
LRFRHRISLHDRDHVQLEGIVLGVGVDLGDALVEVLSLLFRPFVIADIPLGGK